MVLMFRTREIFQRRLMHTHGELEKALLENQDGGLLTLNSGLRSLKQQFRTTVTEYQMDLQAKMKAADMTV